MKGEGRRSVYKRKAPGRQSGGSTEGIPIKTYARGQDRYSKLRDFPNEFDFNQLMGGERRAIIRTVKNLPQYNQVLIEIDSNTFELLAVVFEEFSTKRS